MYLNNRHLCSCGGVIINQVELIILQEIFITKPFVGPLNHVGLQSHSPTLSAEYVIYVKMCPND